MFWLLSLPPSTDSSRIVYPLLPLDGNALICISSAELSKGLPYIKMETRLITVQKVLLKKSTTGLQNNCVPSET